VPLLDVFWVTLMVAGFILALWLVIVVLRDVFDRDDLSTGAKMGWSLLACFLPIVGGLIYLVSQGASPEQLRLNSSRRRNASIYE
jgi:hypothetical protein